MICSDSVVQLNFPAYIEHTSPMRLCARFCEILALGDLAPGAAAETSEVPDGVGAGPTPDAGLFPGATVLGGEAFCCAVTGAARQDAQNTRTALSFIFTAIIIYPKHLKTTLLNPR